MSDSTSYGLPEYPPIKPLRDIVELINATPTIMGGLSLHDLQKAPQAPPSQDDPLVPLYNAYNALLSHVERIADACSEVEQSYIKENTRDPVPPLILGMKEFRNAPPERVPEMIESYFPVLRVLAKAVMRMHQSWDTAIKDRLKELMELPVGWDGYRGSPVSPECARFAKEMLKQIRHDGVYPPSLVAGSDGSLQAEWHWKMYDIELDIVITRNGQQVNHIVNASRDNLQIGQEEYLEIKDGDFRKIAGWIRELADRPEMKDQEKAAAIAEPKPGEILGVAIP